MIMIKKISLVIMVGFLMISCGKKSDPKYSDLEKYIKNQSTLSNKV
jgi:hypothetical protein